MSRYVRLVATDMHSMITPDRHRNRASSLNGTLAERPQIRRATPNIRATAAPMRKTIIIARKTVCRVPMLFTSVS